MSGAPTKDTDDTKEFPQENSFAVRFSRAFFINLGRREDRRHEVQWQFLQHGLEVERLAAADARWVRDARGHETAARYACGLGKRLAIRKARLARAEAVLIFEDDVVLHPEFNERLEALDLPDDWGILLLGCLHVVRPVPVAPGLVRVRAAYDNHAWAVKAEHYDAVLAALKPYGKGCPPCLPASDILLSNLQEKIPSYAAFPNLAWQGLTYSDNLRRRSCNYDPASGRQTWKAEVIRGLDWEMALLGQGIASADQQLFFGDPEMLPAGWIQASGELKLWQCLPLADASVAAMHVASRLSTMSTRQVAGMLEEAFRCLKTGGWLLIEEPDFASLIAEPARVETNGVSIWRHTHSLWTAEMVMRLVERAGFAAVRKGSAGIMPVQMENEELPAAQETVLRVAAAERDGPGTHRLDGCATRLRDGRCFVIEAVKPEELSDEA